MNYLGRRFGYKAVAWRAGCWGERGVQSILRGAFQWVSAHLGKINLIVLECCNGCY